MLHVKRSGLLSPQSRDLAFLPKYGKSINEIGNKLKNLYHFIFCLLEMTHCGGNHFSLILRSNFDILQEFVRPKDQSSGFTIVGGGRFDSL